MKKIINSILSSEIITGNQKIKVAINGFGRIGRAYFKLSLSKPEIEVIAINDLGSIESMIYLLKYDTVYGKSDFEVDQEVVSEKEKYLIVKMKNKNIKKIRFISEKDATLLPWRDLDIDVVVESTGLFTNYEKAKVHIDSGAKKVVISAPSKGDGSVKGETILLGVNEDKFGTCDITSNASCTTNASSPIIAILAETIGIEKAMLNTVHAYTATQALVDGPSKKDLREGRAAAQNIVPSSTGAAIAVGKVFKEIDGKFDGISMRVPIVAGSIVDITFLAKRKTSVEEVNNILREAAKQERWKNIFKVTEEELVSSDIKGELYASIVDLKMTRVVDGDLVKVLAWYDNEMGYTNTLLEHTIKTGKTILK